MNTLAKQIHNIAPETIHTTFADGTEHVLEMQSVEFFQEKFQAIATQMNDDREHRIVTVGPNNEQVIVGREREDGSFEQVGEITEVKQA